MSIYTKTGDSGMTTLWGGKRFRKDHPRIMALGSIDGLNAILGVTSAFCHSRKMKNILREIQNDLFIIQAELASSYGKTKKTKVLAAERTKWLEHTIDVVDVSLPRLRNFTLPGGTKTGALLHYARAVSRRAERDVVKLFTPLESPALKNGDLTGFTPLESPAPKGGDEYNPSPPPGRAAGFKTQSFLTGFTKEKTTNPEILKYLNRLSDFLFMMARWENRKIKEVLPSY